MNQHRDLGHQYEQKAKAYLQAQGLTCIAENFSCKTGEIDLIALGQDTLIFIEVKYRKNSNYGHAAEFITPQKQLRLQRCAQRFLHTQPRYQNMMMRFDALLITGDQIEWIRNAFGGW